MNEKKQEIAEIDRINQEALFFRSTESNRTFELSEEALRRSELAQYD